jgi:hypothetical protein
MPSLFASYLKEESTVVEDINGIVLNEAYGVTGLTPGRMALVQALSSTIAGLPQWGDVHPANNFMYCLKRVPRPLAKVSNYEAIVVCMFATPDIANPLFPILNYYGTSVETITNFDINGKPIEVNYTPTGKASSSTATDESVFFESPGNDPLPTQIGQVRGTKALGFLTYDFLLPQDPSYLSAYQNKLNSTTFRGGAPYTYLLKDVKYSQILFRNMWRVHLGFSFDSETHLHTAAYRLLGGIVPADIDSINIPKVLTSGNGYTNVLTNFTINFNQIGIPLAI